MLCAHFPALYPSTQDRAWGSFGRGVEAEKGEEEGRVSAGPVLGAGATKRSHSWPCPEEPPFCQEKTGKRLWKVVKTGWYSCPTHQGDVIEKVKLPEALSTLPEPHRIIVGAWETGRQ